MSELKALKKQAARLDADYWAIAGTIECVRVGLTTAKNPTARNQYAEEMKILKKSEEEVRALSISVNEKIERLSPCFIA